MAKRNIVKVGDSLLRMKSKPVYVFDDGLSQLLDDMRETMLAENGVGIAAVQVGVLRRVCAVYDGVDFYEFVNPTILKATGKQSSTEGCLSVPNKNGIVERPKKLVVKAFDRYGAEFEFVASGYLAVICSHEFDHLDGVLFIDKVKKED